MAITRRTYGIFSRDKRLLRAPSPDDEIIRYLIEKLPDERRREREQTLLSSIRRESPQGRSSHYLKQFLEVERSLVASAAEPEYFREELRREITDRCNRDGATNALRSVLGPPTERAVYQNVVLLEEVLRRILDHFGEAILLQSLTTSGADLKGILYFDGEFHTRDFVRRVLKDSSSVVDSVDAFQERYENLLQFLGSTTGRQIAEEMFSGAITSVSELYGATYATTLVDSLPISLRSYALAGRVAAIRPENLAIPATPYAESLMKDREMLALIVRYMREGVLIVDLSATITFANDKARTILGLDSSNLTPADIQSAFTRAFPKVRLAEMLAECMPTGEYSVPNVESRGRVFKLLFQSLSAEVGVPHGALIWIIDTTKALEEERRRNDFVSLITHQLRTPLSGIKWTLLMFIRGDLGELTNEQKVFLMKSYESNQRMVNLVDSILVANELVTGRYRYNFVPIQILDLCENILYELQPSAKRKQIAIEFPSRGAHISRVMLDAEKMRSVIQNLLENAVKYTPPSGKVILSVEESDGHVKVSVTDSGIGIPKDEQKHIFKQFFRAANVAQGEGMSGSGLGLFIARSIIETHNGTIWFESVEGKGTTFSFRVPLIPQNAINQ